MNLVFLGPAGSGKGTQAKKLESAYGVTQISTGDLLREAVRAGTPLGMKAEPLMKQGKLVPDDLVIGIIEDRFLQGGIEKGVLLDGFPRTLPQAEALDSMFARNGLTLDRVISLEVPSSILIDRVTGRRSCPKCGAVYHVTAAPPKTPGVCDLDGTALIQRSDDTAEKLANRLAVFDTEIPQVKRHYAAQGLLAEVSGMGTPDEVFDRIRGALGA